MKAGMVVVRGVVLASCVAWTGALCAREAAVTSAVMPADHAKYLAADADAMPADHAKYMAANADAMPADHAKYMAANADAMPADHAKYLAADADAMPADHAKYLAADADAMPADHAKYLAADADAMPPDHAKYLDGEPAAMPPDHAQYIDGDDEVVMPADHAKYLDAEDGEAESSGDGAHLGEADAASLHGTRLAQAPHAAPPPSLAAPDAPVEMLVRRHIYFLREGLDTLWGNYVFAVDNPGSAPARFESLVMLPKEASDWQPVEGLAANDLTLADSGPLLSKEFAPGIHIVGFGFRVNAFDGQATMTLEATAPIDTLTLLVPKDSAFSISSSQLRRGQPEDSPDPSYVAYLNPEPIAAGSRLKVEVGGIARGRGMLWMIGGTFAALLVLVAAFLAWRTRPRFGDTHDVRDMVAS